MKQANRRKGSFVAKVRGILVLESPWGEDLSDNTSVRPFIEGWAKLHDISVCYRMYHDAEDLRHWLQEFSSDTSLSACYIAGHGIGGRLSGRNSNINLMNLAAATSESTPGRNMRKGVLLGTCDVGNKLQDFLNACGEGISWCAGYTKTVPWVESTLCDVLFLDYVLNGRRRRSGQGFEMSGKGEIKVQRAKSAQKACQWLVKDMAVAKLCGFVAVDR